MRELWQRSDRWLTCNHARLNAVELWTGMTAYGLFDSTAGPLCGPATTSTDAKPAQLTMKVTGADVSAMVPPPP